MPLTKREAEKIEVHTATRLEDAIHGLANAVEREVEAAAAYGESGQTVTVLRRIAQRWHDLANSVGTV